jgi:hypothetical protein
MDLDRNIRVTTLSQNLIAEFRYHHKQLVRRIATVGQEGDPRELR